PLVLITAPAPERDPTVTACPFASSRAPAARSRCPPAGNASPLAVRVACETVVEEGQRPVVKATTVAFATVPCASNPEIAIPPAAPVQVNGAAPAPKETASMTARARIV